jgi:hypothetical protein
LVFQFALFAGLITLALGRQLWLIARKNDKLTRGEWTGIGIGFIGVVLALLQWFGITPSFLGKYSNDFAIGLALIGTFLIAFLIGRWTKPPEVMTQVDKPLVKIGGTTLPTSALYKLENLPHPDKILQNAKHSVYFTGGNLDGLVNSYAAQIREYAGKVKMGFLFVDPLSPMGQAMETYADPVKNIHGQTGRAISTLLGIRDKTLPEARRNEFEIRVHNGLPFSMILVDIEDRENSVIQIGYYAQMSASSYRPCALVSPKTETYDILLKEFKAKWEQGGEGGLPHHYI